MAKKKTQIEIANDLRFKAEKGFTREEANNAKANIIAMANGADNETVRLNANKDIVDRTEGKATQDIEHGGKDGGAIKIEWLKDE